MASNGKARLIPFTDAEVLALMKPGVAYFNSAECVIKDVPEAFSQPSEVQAVHDDFRMDVDAAHPSDGKQTVANRRAKRLNYNEKMGNFVDLVALGARKDPSLPAKFGMELLIEVKPKSASKGTSYSIPVITVQVVDKEPTIIHGKVRGGVRKAIEIYHTYDDPTIEANWGHFDSYADGTFIMTGMTSGRRAYIKGRYIFGKGKKSPWSDVVSIMVP